MSFHRFIVLSFYRWSNDNLTKKEDLPSQRTSKTFHSGEDKYPENGWCSQDHDLQKLWRKEASSQGVSCMLILQRETGAYDQEQD